MGGSAATGEKSSGGCCPFGTAGIGLDRQRAGGLKALFCEAGSGRMGLLIAGFCSSRRNKRSETQMTRSLSLQQLFGKTRDRAPEQNTAQESLALGGMIESGDFKIDLA